MRLLTLIGTLRGSTQCLPFRIVECHLPVLADIEHRLEAVYLGLR
jgi:hypothetical protein